MIKCPACGHENVPGTQFCEGCGEELAADTTAAFDDESTPDAAAAGEIRCPACDNLNPSDNAICEVCGTELPGGAASTPPQSTPVASDTVGGGDALTTDGTADTPIAMPAATQPQDDAAASDDTAGDDADNADSFQIPASAPPAGGGTAQAPAGQLSDTTGLTSTAPDAPVPQTATTSTQPAPDDAPGDTAVQTDAAAADSGAADLLPGRVKLVVEQGMNVGKQFVLGDAQIAVGREDEDEEIYPDIDLADQDEGYVHREHATMNFDNGALTVTHLGGANRTRVNNRPIPDNEPQPLKLGDKVSFGKVVLRVMPHV